MKKGYVSRKRWNIVKRTSNTMNYVVRLGCLALFSMISTTISANPKERDINARLSKPIYSKCGTYEHGRTEFDEWMNDEFMRQYYRYIHENRDRLTEQDKKDLVDAQIRFTVKKNGSLQILSIAPQDISWMQREIIQRVFANSLRWTPALREGSYEAFEMTERWWAPRWAKRPQIKPKWAAVLPDDVPAGHIVTPPAMSEHFIRELAAYRKIYSVKADGFNNRIPGEWILDKPREIEQSRYQLYFDVVAIKDTIRGERLKETAILQIGDRWTKWFGLSTFIRDYNNACIRAKQPEKKKDVELRGKSIVDYEIFSDRKNDKLENWHREYLRRDYRVHYSEPTPTFDWQITSHQEEIAGYLCRQATTTFRGRQWTVWFTEELTEDAGPWKFSGLPGVILKAKDSRGEYLFTCTRVEQSQNAIVRYDGIPTDHKSRKAWLKRERDLHTRPYQEICMKQHVGIVVIQEDQSHKLLRDDWTIPYNPIETE
ncbi:MAG: GLPGLI family protein [Rikenellaceae bacterium]|nr:GLPGLI family protein [Rikenellaceae bacterium]